MINPLHERLLEKVLNQIKIDLEDGIEDTITEMLKYCPNKNLISFLPEEDWEEFKQLENE